MAKVAMFVFNSLEHDARVHRQAEALAGAGHKVRIYAFFEEPCREREKYPAGYEAVRLDSRSWLDRRWSEWFPRPRGSKTTPVVERLDLPPERPPQRPCPPPPARQLPPHSSPQRRQHRDYILQVNVAWWKSARRWQPDICQAHDLDALWAAQNTARTCGSALLYDSHEIWAEQHFLPDQEEVDYWNRWEGLLASSVDAWVTVNHSLAEIFSQRYQVQSLPLHNCPRLQPLDPNQVGRLRQDYEGRPVAIFSGGFHTHRGLEEMIAAALLQKEVAIVLQGFGPQEEALRQLASEFRSPVGFLPKVPHQQLSQICSQADIGVMPVLPTCLNSYYCAPNKLFDYMMAGLPVVAADLPEMSRFLDQCGNGELYDAFSPNDLAASLVRLAASPQLKVRAAASRHWAEQEFHWEKESQKLIRLVEELIQRRQQGELREKPHIHPEQANQGINTNS